MNSPISASIPSEREVGTVTVVGLAFAYSPVYVSRVLGWVGADWGPRGPPSVLLWNWLAVSLLLAFVSKVEGRGLALITLARPSGTNVLWAVVFGAVAIVTRMALTVIAPLPPGEGLDTVLDLSLPLAVAIVLTTSITEEILYRGYVIPHVQFFGPQWFVSNGVSVVLLYVLYVWRRNLVACMTMHLLGDSVALIPVLSIGS